MPKLREEDKILKEKIKERIIQLLEEHFGTQTSASKNLDIDRQNFNPWVNLKNDRGATIYSINRICEAIEIDLSDFFDDPIFRKK